MNRKAFGASFLYWVDFSKIQMRLDTSFFLIVLAFASFEIASHFFAGMINISIDRKKGDNLLLIQGLVKKDLHSALHFEPTNIKLFNFNLCNSF